MQLKPLCLKLTLFNPGGCIVILCRFWNPSDQNGARIAQNPSKNGDFRRTTPRVKSPFFDILEIFRPRWPFLVRIF